jgi:hypothetical protein
MYRWMYIVSVETFNEARNTDTTFTNSINTTNFQVCMCPLLLSNMPRPQNGQV